MPLNLSTNHSPVAPGESLLMTHPMQLSGWHPIYNQELSPINFTRSSTQIVWWLCQRNVHHSYQLSIAQHILASIEGESACPHCNELEQPKQEKDSSEVIGQDAIPASNLANSHPSIAAQWDYQRNHPKLPEQVKSFSDEEAWWNCPIGHNFSASTRTRTFSYTPDIGCPHCAQLPQADYKELVKTEKQIQAQKNKNSAWKKYNTTRNRPQEFSATNKPSEPALSKWQCRANSDHPFDEELYVKMLAAKESTRCTYCQLERERPDSFYNKVLPDIAKEFSGRNLISILAVKPASKTPLLWTCSKCSQEWLATPQERFYKTNECPSCAAPKPVQTL